MDSIISGTAHRHGNYHKYYTFHPSEARSCFFSGRHIFRTLWEAQGCPRLFSILDIGCNEGDLSMDMLQQARADICSLPNGRDVRCVLLGIDLDSSLIQIANEKLLSPQYTSLKTDVLFAALDFMDTKVADDFLRFYCQSLCQDKGRNPGDMNVDGSRSHGSRTPDMPPSELSSLSFSLVCMFSITMWIHLNHGDVGLVDFLRRGARLVQLHNQPEGEAAGSLSGGSLVVEPQPWKCYRSAQRRDRRLGICRPPHMQPAALRIRGDMAQLVTHMLLSPSSADTPGAIPAVALTSARASERVGSNDTDLPGQQRRPESADCTREPTCRSKKPSKSERKRQRRIASSGGSGDGSTEVVAPASRDHLEDSSTDVDAVVPRLRMMQSVWDLGQEEWGRNILIFHCAQLAPLPTLATTRAVPSPQGISLTADTKQPYDLASTTSMGIGIGVDSVDVGIGADSVGIGIGPDSVDWRANSKFAPLEHSCCNTAVGATKRQKVNRSDLSINHA